MNPTIHSLYYLMFSLQTHSFPGLNQSFFNNTHSNYHSVFLQFLFKSLMKLFLQSYLKISQCHVQCSLFRISTNLTLLHLRLLYIPSFFKTFPSLSYMTILYVGFPPNSLTALFILFLPLYNSYLGYLIQQRVSAAI